MNIIPTHPVHLLIFPFPASGHIIPLLDFTRRLLTRHPAYVTVTFLITPTSLPLLQPLLNTFPSSQLQPLILSPPPTPTTSSLISKIRALHALEGPIISWFNSHPSPPRVLICDFFLPWTHSLNLPRVIFYPSGAFSSSIMYSMWAGVPSNPEDDPDFEVQFDDVTGSPKFKWFELSMLFRLGKPGEQEWDLFRSELLRNLTSWGAIINSFSELESVYLDHFKTKMGHDRVWVMGPLLPAEGNDVAQRGGPSSEEVLTWLDGKLEGSVVYVCFGSRTSLTEEESKVLGAALEGSGVHFIWCVPKSNGPDRATPDSDYEDRVAGRGFILRGWAPQVAILRHKAVTAFLTHCGWNSVLESISSGVMMLAWPMGADQYSNAQLVVGQLGLGLQIMCHGPDGVPNQDELLSLLVDSVSPTRSEKDRVMGFSLAAATAVEGGSSATDLGKFIECLSGLKK